MPTFTIALVFVFFLVASLLFEKGVEWLTHLLERLGRPGLVEALQKLVLVGGAGAALGCVSSGRG